MRSDADEFRGVFRVVCACPCPASLTDGPFRAAAAQSQRTIRRLDPSHELDPMVSVVVGDGYPRGASHGAAPHPAIAFPRGCRLRVLWAVGGAILDQYSSCVDMYTPPFTSPQRRLCVGPQGRGWMGF